MTDYFDVLEEHLLDAARRRRRLRLQVGPALSAAIAAGLVAVSIALWPSSVDEREVSVQAPTPTPTPAATGCGQATDAEPPARWSDTLAVLARPASDAERAFGQPVPAALAQQGAYRNFARLARVVDGREYWLVPVRNVLPDGECPGQGREMGGVCLYIVERGAGKLQNCSTPAGIRALMEWTARPVQGEREIVGVMPDDVATMQMDDPDLGRRTFDIVGNVVVGRVAARDPSELDNARWTFFDAQGREVQPESPS